MLSQGKLPNIKALINDGAKNFSNSFVVNSTCCPSRATFMTGKYSHNTGVYNVVGSNGAYPAFKDKKENLANWLKDTHNTAYIGKFIVDTRLLEANKISCNPDSSMLGWDFFLN